MTEIEQVRAGMETRHARRCGHMTMRGVNAKETIFARLDCKCWDCAKCGPRKAGRYKHSIRRAAEALQLRRFLTLTLDPKKLPEGADSVRYLRESFSKLRTYWKRKFGENIQYIAVLEFHENGNPHLHCLVDRYMEHAWIKSAWMAVGGGQHVDIRAVDLHRVSRYLAKYLTKELLMSAPQRSRRVTVSRGIALNPKATRPREHKWERLKITIYELFRRFQLVAKDVLLDADNLVQSFTAPPGTFAFPNVRGIAVEFIPSN